MALQLRSPDDVRRLFSALAETNTVPSDLSVADVDALTLSGDLGEGENGSVTLSLLVALATSWVAIRGFQRSGGSISWGLAWGALGYLVPLPAVALSYYRDVTAHG